jgi:pimeloyl-ACP methyl ester carboxylesterase
MSLSLRRRRPRQPDPAATLDDLHEPVNAPGPLLLMLEARAPWEYAAMLAATPWLRRLPDGDGHPVVVFPGLGATDLSTAPLRSFLTERGYAVYPWEQGFNFGPRHGVLAACRERVQQVTERHGVPASLVGWSLGGIYAREMAKELADRVRCVVTLGTPFAGHPKATNAWRFYQLVSGQRVLDPALVAQIRQPPGCPTTSIFSKTDGIVAWPCSLNEDAPHTENIEVQASHVGMGMNPLALYAVADRLAQDPKDWKRFDASGYRRWFFKPAAKAPATPAAPA